ncbi:MAG: folate-binding protein [Pseudomonadota bacterium]
MASWTRLDDRGVVSVAGTDARALLQGLISNDLDGLTPTHPLYAALLTPQGKYLFDFIVIDAGDHLLLDVEKARASDLVRRLTLYRLRADVQFAILDEVCVHAVFGELAELPPLPETATLADPRHPDLGWRALGAPDHVAAALGDVASPTDMAAYDRHRLELGVPDGSRDLEIDRALLLESGFVELNGVAFDKGCFIGQELTARMRYRSTVRKRLLPVRIEGHTEPGSLIKDGEVDVGELRSIRDGRGLALIRIERWRAAAAAGRRLQAGDATVEPSVPDWVDLSFASKAAETSA